MLNNDFQDTENRKKRMKERKKERNTNQNWRSKLWVHGTKSMHEFVASGHRRKWTQKRGRPETWRKASGCGPSRYTDAEAFDPETGLRYRAASGVIECGWKVELVVLKGRKRICRQFWFAVRFYWESLSIFTLVIYKCLFLKWLNC